MKFEIYMIAGIMTVLFSNTDAMQKHQSQMQQATQETIRKELAAVLKTDAASLELKVAAHGDEQLTTLLSQEEIQLLTTDFAVREKELRAMNDRNSQAKKFSLYARGVASGYVRGFQCGYATAMNSKLASLALWAKKIF